MIGERIRAKRKSLNWTQDHLAELAGIAKTTLSQIETGARNPGFETLHSLAESLNMPVKELFDDLGSNDRETQLRTLFAGLSIEDQTAIIKHATALARLAEIGRIME